MGAEEVGPGLAGLLFGLLTSPAFSTNSVQPTQTPIYKCLVGDKGHM